MTATTGGRPAEKNGAEARAREVIMRARKIEDPEKRGAFLESERESFKAELDIAMLAREHVALEALSVSYGSGSTDFSLEDPANDDGEVWNELGYRGAGGTHHAKLRTAYDLTRARSIGRHLHESNSLAIGAHETRQDYYVGYGLMWRVVPKDPKRESKPLTAQITKALEDFSRANHWGAMEREAVMRADRDGEFFQRLYLNAEGPLQVRFWEPEHVVQPTDATTPEREARHAFGVEVEAGKPVAYWMLHDGDTSPQRIPARMEGVDIPAVIHHKANADSSMRRGWPTMEPISKNLARLEKLLRNMSWVAALQAAIAMIKRYDASEAQVNSALQRNADLTATNTTTNKTATYLEIRPGTVFHAPKGQSYEAPIQNANPERFVTVYQADARAASARLRMPEYMFTNDMGNAAYSAHLVGESPFVKHVEAMQWVYHRPFSEVVLAAIAHEEFWGRIPAGTMENYTLQCEFPNPIVRAQLETAQKNQIEKAAGVLSVQTWRAQIGLDDTIEEQNIDEAIKRGYPDPRKPVTPPTDKPPPGSTEGGPGGEDQIDPEKPEKTRKADVSESRGWSAVMNCDGQVRALSPTEQSLRERIAHLEGFHEAKQSANVPQAPPPAPLPAPNVHLFMEAPAAAPPVVVPAPQVTAFIQTPEQQPPQVKVDVHMPQQAPPVVHVHTPPPVVPTVKKRGRMERTADGKGWEFVATEAPE